MYIRYVFFLFWYTSSILKYKGVENATVYHNYGQAFCSVLSPCLVANRAHSPQQHGTPHFRGVPTGTALLFSLFWFVLPAPLPLENCQFTVCSHRYRSGVLIVPINASSSPAFQMPALHIGFPSSTALLSQLIWLVFPVCLPPKRRCLTSSQRQRSSPILPPHHSTCFVDLLPVS